MRDRKYLHLVVGRARLRATYSELEAVRSRRLRRVVKTFTENIQRVTNLAIGLGAVAYSIRRDQWCVDYSTFKAEGVVKEPFVVFAPSDAVRKEYARQMEIIDALPEERASELTGHWGAGSIGVMLKTTPGMDIFIDALLSSVIVESWIAFETLVSDLWVAAIDFGPARLRKQLILRIGRLESSEDALDAPKLDDVEHDPSRKLGSALREARRVSFQRLYRIIRYYELVFGKEVKKIFRDTERGYISVVSAYRNAFIHNGGRADATFLRQIGGRAEFKKIKRNQKLLLDGQLVKKLSSASIEVGTKLIQFVDDVLTPPRPKA
jgi:hypothetical protein